ncbi:TetR/AcrR family transcriptional regulator [Parvularcula lutaonensis]|uniref:TetR/AcrR family transcriptional regulator n=1 Tax=Parvularcula lutaonensis TaxID=491923 RepID=A0ABV7MBP9_9PROT|nr:TetR family transcriptional regulator [Parvularcula lutaonensis]GGY48919.1 TetR family transcriptional regulator [Parvularcula lutaonensis]
MPRLNLTEEETRNLILDNADRLFTDIGYDKTTVADIARACGFSPANVHRVLGTKGQINRAIAERKLQGKLHAARTEAWKKESAAERLEEFFRTVNRLTYETFTERARVHDMVAAAIEERWQEVIDYRVGLLATARDIIAYGVERGEFDIPDIDDAAQVVHIIGLRFFHPLCVAELEEAPDGGTLDQAIPYILRMLGAKTTG